MNILNSTISNLNNIINSCETVYKDSLRFVSFGVVSDSAALNFGLKIGHFDNQYSYIQLEDHFIGKLIKKDVFNAVVNCDRFKFHVGAQGDFSEKFVQAYVNDFIDQTDGLHFNNKLLNYIQEIADLTDKISNMDVTKIDGVVLNGSKFLLLSDIQILSLVDGIKRAAVEILETHSEEITPANNAPQQILWLNERGVIEYLRKEYKSDLKIAQILSVLLGYSVENLRKIVGDMKTGGAPNDPYNVEKNRRWAENQTKKIGL